MVQGKKTETLQETLDAITFKNEQARKIKAIQEGKEKLKDRLGRKKIQNKVAFLGLKAYKVYKVYNHYKKNKKEKDEINSKFTGIFKNENAFRTGGSFN